MAGLKTGTYLAPLPRPGYGKSTNEIVYNEYLHELARQAAIEHFKDPVIHHMTLSMIADGLQRIDTKLTENERREEKVDDRLKMDLLNRINNIKAQG